MGGYTILAFNFKIQIHSQTEGGYVYKMVHIGIYGRS